jgi:[acyl-carrier-protein] S-malonyltransferase
MQPAAAKLQEALANIHFTTPQVPVVANVTAKPITDANEFEASLVRQLYSPVLWEDTIRYLLQEGVDTFIEVGSGNVLSGLTRKVDRKVTMLQVQDEASLEKTLAQLTALEEGKVTSDVSR